MPRGAKLVLQLSPNFTAYVLTRDITCLYSGA